MKNKHNGFMTPRMAALVISLAAGVAGCNLANTLPPAAASLFTDGAPVLYRFSASDEMVRTAVDRSKEGLVLSTSLEELVLPVQWAKVEGTSPFTLYNLTVDPIGSEASAFVSSGGVYYAKYLQIGTGDTAKVFTATAGVNAPVWSHVAGDVTLTLNSSLSEADRKWYWEQMAAGNYFILDASQTPWAGVDYTRLSTGAAAFSGVTKENRWLKSFRDSAWKSGRDALATFIAQKILTGTDTLTKVSQSGRWFLGVDDTAVPSTWDFNAYFDFVLEAYKSEGTVDVVTSPSS